MAKVIILDEYCKSCSLCIGFCPKGVLKIGNRANSKGYYTVVAIDQETCTGCGVCGIMCPDLALEIYR